METNIRSIVDMTKLENLQYISINDYIKSKVMEKGLSWGTHETLRALIKERCRAGNVYVTNTGWYRKNPKSNVIIKEATNMIAFVSLHNGEEFIEGGYIINYNLESSSRRIIDISYAEDINVAENAFVSHLAGRSYSHRYSLLEQENDEILRDKGLSSKLNEIKDNAASTIADVLIVTQDFIKFITDRQLYDCYLDAKSKDVRDMVSSELKLRGFAL